MPAAARPSSITTRLARYRRTWPLTSSVASRPANAATCDTCGAQMKRFCCNRSTVSTTDSGATTQPTRHPVIDQYLEKLLMTNASG